MITGAGSMTFSCARVRHGPMDYCFENKIVSRFECSLWNRATARAARRRRTQPVAGGKPQGGAAPGGFALSASPGGATEAGPGLSPFIGSIDDESGSWAGKSSRPCRGSLRIGGPYPGRRCACPGLLACGSSGPPRSGRNR
jgi:hypothetical protein